MKVKISVIIPTYNSWKTLKNCLRSILSQSLKPSEIIVVDNASTDGTSNNLIRDYSSIKLVKLSTNKGVTGGRINNPAAGVTNTAADNKSRAIRKTQWFF